MLRITKKSLLIVGVLAVIFTFVLSGCANPFASDDDDGSSTDGDDTATLDPTSETPESSDELSDSEASTYIESSAGSFDAVSSYMEPPADAQSVQTSSVSLQKTETWTTPDGLDVTWIYEEKSDRETWEIVLDGEYEGKDYDGWTLMDGHRLTDEYGGKFTVYDVNLEDPDDRKEAVWEWCTDEEYYYYLFDIDEGTPLQIATDELETTGEGEFDVYPVGTDLDCGTAETETEEIFEAGWNPEGVRWIDESDNEYAYPEEDPEKDPPADVDDPLDSGDDA